MAWTSYCASTEARAEDFYSMECLDDSKVRLLRALSNKIIHPDFNILCASASWSRRSQSAFEKGNSPHNLNLEKLSPHASGTMGNINVATVLRLRSFVYEWTEMSTERKSYQVSPQRAKAPWTWSSYAMLQDVRSVWSYFRHATLRQRIRNPESSCASCCALCSVPLNLHFANHFASHCDCPNKSPHGRIARSHAWARAHCALYCHDDFVHPCSDSSSLV